MKITTGVLIGVLCFLLISFKINGQATDQWHYPLYLSNMGYWHSRIPVVIENSSAQDVSGESVRMKIGKGEGLLPLAEVDASGLRVVESGGTELLWRITSPDKEIVTEGSIPEKSEFILPVTVTAGKSEIYYIYYDNPATWPVGAVLEEVRYGRKDGKQPQILKEDALHLEILATQTISLSEDGRNEEWPGDTKWDIRVPIKIFNFRDNQLSGLPVYVKMEQVYLRLHDKKVQYASMQLGNKLHEPYFRF